MSQASSISNLATSAVQSLVPYQPGKPISELERELGLETIVKLASNENPLGPSPKVVAAVNAALSDLSLYPDGNGYDLKQALSEKLGVDTNQITLGNGSNEILEIIARTFLTENSAAVFSEYAFAVYPLVTQAIGAKSQVAKAADGSKYPEFGHDLDGLLAAITDQTRIVFIANPNNPTGTYLLSEQLLGFFKALPTHVICVLDEAYFEYVEALEQVNMVERLPEFPNLIITRTFSKAYGLAGLRVGYSISSSDIANLLNRVREPFNNNSLALVGAQAALTDQQYLHQSLAVNSEGMRQFTDYFNSTNLSWIPSMGNFITVNLKRDAMAVYQQLLHKGVIVRSVANYGLPEHLRISIGSGEDNQRCITALTEILDV